MVYSLDNAKVVTLKDFGEDRFVNELQYLKDLNHPSDERNREWLDLLPVTYNDDKRYKEWFFLVEDNKMLAFATIQPYYSGCYRMVTRLYQIPEIRRFTEPRFDKRFSPSLRILTEQLKYLDDWKTLIVSVQDSSRRRFAERYINKLIYRTGLDWKLNDDMMCVGNNPHHRDYWQNVMYTGKKPILYQMSIERYNEIWKKP